MTLSSGLLANAVAKQRMVKGPKGGASMVAIEPGDMVYSTL